MIPTGLRKPEGQTGESATAQTAAIGGSLYRSLSSEASGSKTGGPSALSSIVKAKNEARKAKLAEIRNKVSLFWVRLLLIVDHGECNTWYFNTVVAHTPFFSFLSEQTHCMSSLWRPLYAAFVFEGMSWLQPIDGKRKLRLRCARRPYPV
jgi:hypothetical protein